MKRAIVIGLVVVVVVGVGFLVYRARCEDGSEGLVEFPYEIEIAPQNVLFVDGYEFHGKVTCTWEPGDSLRIEGIPILPRRPRPRELYPSEERVQKKWANEPFVRQCVEKGMTWHEAVREYELSERYGQVPFVKQLVEQGRTWAAAVHEYNKRIEEITSASNRAYWKVLLSTGSKELAAQAALDSLERTFVDPSFEPKASAYGMVVKFQGYPVPHSIAFSEKPPWEMPSLEELQRVTRKKASDVARRLQRYLSQTGTQALMVGSGHLELGGGVVEEAMRQIEEGRKGRLVEGPLDERELKLILLRKGVKIDELQ